MDGGTIWGRPLTKSGLTDATRDFVPAARVDGDGGDAGEDGEGGDANDVVGNGGAWGGSLGRFATLQNHDQALYAAAPSYFYGSWGLAALWPGLDLALVADRLAAAATASDDAERPIAWARARDGASTTARKRRKVHAAAHDLGAPRAAPLTSSPNAHDVTDVNGWKDLAPQLMLLVARAHAFIAAGSSRTIAGALAPRACSNPRISPSETRCDTTTRTATAPSSTSAIRTRGVPITDSIDGRRRRARTRRTAEVCGSPRFASAQEWREI